MGGKSSKANEKFIDKSLQEPPKVRGYPDSQNDRFHSERRKTPRSRTPPNPAWGKSSERSSKSKDHRVSERSKGMDTSWGKTSFNTFDLHSYDRSPSTQSHEDLRNKENYNKFSEFNNITDKREQKQKRDKGRKEEEARNKSKSVVSSPKKSFSKYNGSSKSNRRNSLPFEQTPERNYNRNNNQPFSKSSPQRKKLAVQKSNSAERRISDVSTLSLSENTIPTYSTFKPIRQTKNNNYGANKSSKAAASIYGKNTNNNYSPKKRYSEKPPERRITTPPKVHPEALKPTTQARRQPASFSRINSLTIGPR